MLTIPRFALSPLYSRLMTKHIFFIIAVVLLVLFYLSFLETFVFIQKFVNVPLIIAVFITVTIGYERGYFFALVAGLILDLYSSHIFGTYTLAMLLPVIVMYGAFRQLFARKSMYSLMLVMIAGTLLYHGLVWFITHISFWLNWRSYRGLPLEEYLPQIGWQVVAHSVLIVLLYVIIHFIVKRFRLRFRISQRV